MAIEILKSKRRVRRFLSYDMEWIPGTLQIRVVGVYDGSEYRSYKSVGAFLAHELSSENRGSWFFAHAGGLADVQFVLEHLVSNPYYREYTVKASFSGSSAIIVRVTKGKNSWIFLDSYWLLRDKLKNIATMIGMEKTGPDFDDWSEEQIKEWYASIDYPTLERYNCNDCIILWRAIDIFETALLELGGQLQMTLASSALQLFRRKYLTKNVETSAAINEKAKESYFASRVERFCTETTNGLYYDINSSFPYAMTFPCPGECIGVDRSLPLFEDRIFMSDVEIEVPDFYLTPTPKRAGGRIFFPFGRWRSWLTSVDLELLVREGGRILQVFQTFHFEPFYDLSDFARTIYSKRVATDDPVEKYTYKILLNSTYGKFAESEEKSIVHVHPSEHTLSRLSFDNLLFPGAYEETMIVPVPHTWVPISTHITSLARATLYKFLGMTRSFHYCDTDGFSTNDRFQTSTELGGLKLEKTQQAGEPWVFIQAKLYRLGDKVKAKGFSLGWDEKNAKKKERAIELFEDLLEGKEIQVTRMNRIKQNFRLGTWKPSEVLVKKRIKDAMPKRCHHPVTGVSRPWSVEELRKRGLK
jgi:hypothetical protein